MITIRGGVFETNSSSTHAICIHKQENLELPPYVYFGLMDLNDGHYWEGLQEKANYLHTIMYELSSKTNYVSLKNTVTETLKKYGIKCEWAKTKWKEDGYSLDIYDVKDTCEWGILKHISPNEKELLQYLFDKNSRVIYGYDGVYEELMEEAEKKFPEGEEYTYYKGWCDPDDND